MSPSVGKVSVIMVSDKQITSSYCQKCNWYSAPNFEQVLLASTPLGVSYTLLRNFWNIIFFPDMTCFALVTTFLTQNFKMPKLDSALDMALQRLYASAGDPYLTPKKSCIVIFLFMSTKTGVHKDKWCFYAKKNHTVSLKT